MRLFYFLGKVGVLLGWACSAWGQQFAGTSASNSSPAAHNDDVFRGFKDEEYVPAMFQFKWLDRTLYGYTKAQWEVGVLADGDFSRALTDKSVAPRTGQLGLNAIKTVALYQLRAPQEFNAREELRDLFSLHQRKAKLYDERRGSLSWDAFAVQVKSWQQRRLADSLRRDEVRRQIKKLHIDSIATTNTDIYKLERYKEAVAPRRTQLDATATAAHKAIGDYELARYNKFLRALQLQYSETPAAVTGLGLTQATWEQALGFTFLTPTEQRALRARRSPPLTTEETKSLQVSSTPLGVLAFVFGPRYLDSLATTWPNVRRRRFLLLQQAQNADDLAASGTPLAFWEHSKLVAQMQGEYTALLRGQRDTLAQLTQRIGRLNQAIAAGTLPFEKLRYLNRLALNLVVSLGNNTDSLRARTTAGPPPVITNRELFGSNLLVPGSAVQAARSVSINVVLNPFTPRRPTQAIWGFHGFLNYSTTRWAVPGALRGTAAADSTYQVGIFSLSTGLQYTVFQVPSTTNAAGNREGNNVELAFQADLVYRNIGGEIGRPRHEAARDALLGTHRRDYLGFQPSFIASIDNFRVTVSYPIFFKGEIAGFSSGGYPVIGFGFSGDLQAGHSRPSGARPWRRLFDKELKKQEPEKKPKT